MSDHALARLLLGTISASAVVAALALPASAQVQGKVGQYSDATIEGNVVEPHPVIMNDDAELAGKITVPDGFTVEVVGRNLGNARMIAGARERDGLHHPPHRG